MEINSEEGGLTFAVIERKTPVLSSASVESELLAWPPPQWGLKSRRTR